MHCYFNHSLSSELQGIDISMVSYDGIMYASAVYNHWTGLVDCHFYALKTHSLSAMSCIVV